MDDVKEVLRAELRVSRAESDARFDRLEGKVDRIAETLSAMLSDHKQRFRTT